MTRQTLSANHPSLATSYNSIGVVYSNMGEYSKALSYFERAEKICQTVTACETHPHIKAVRDNICSVNASILGKDLN